MLDTSYKTVFFFFRSSGRHSPTAVHNTHLFKHWKYCGEQAWDKCSVFILNQRHCLFSRRPSTPGYLWRRKPCGNRITLLSTLPTPALSSQQAWTIFKQHIHLSNTWRLDPCLFCTEADNEYNSGKPNLKTFDVFLSSENVLLVPFPLFSSKLKNWSTDGNYSCDTFGLSWTRGIDSDWLSTPRSEASDMTSVSVDCVLHPSFRLIYVCFQKKAHILLIPVWDWDCDFVLALDIHSIYHIRFFYKNVLDELEIKPI